MKAKLILEILITVIITGCQAIRAWEPTPLPGWRLPVSALLVEDDAFPKGWVRMREFPDVPDPTINHVYRSWWNQARGTPGGADQAIWRAYTTEEAQEKYNKLRRQPILSQSYTPSPWDTIYVEFKSPPEINFRSSAADEFYLACGWLGKAECHVIARYHNYVTYMTLSLEAEYDGHVSYGLTYSEIEAVVRAMDAKFAEAMKAFYPETKR